ncbi:MAG: endonuclease/exonuclease/phosphatase family protein [Paracoccaceae bacterium]
MRVATFNLQNLRLRLREDRPVLDGAADQDGTDQPRSVAQARADRVETARVIAACNADVVALQEVFDLAALEFFHDQFLTETGAQPYPHRYCIKGNDGRSRNVAALCRPRPLEVKSHAELTGADLGLTDLPADLRDHPLFRRDCLELAFDTVTIFICHFKAPYPDADQTHTVREAEARAVRAIIEARFADPAQERWIILGDFNEPAHGRHAPVSALAPLKSGFAVDLLDRLKPGADWTYEAPVAHLRSRPDRIFLSPALARDYPDTNPRILRSGMEVVKYPADDPADPADRGTGTHPRASDHALVFADFPGL